MANVTWIKAPILFVLFLTFFSVNAQTNFLERADYDSIRTVANKQNKLMFLLVHEQNESFEFLKASVSKKNKEYIGDKFVSGIVQVKREDFQHSLRKGFYLTRPVYLFTDNEGYPVLRYDRPIMGEQLLLQLADSAYTLAKGETLGKLLKQYQKGVRNRGLLTKLLTQYQFFNYYADQRILNDYLSQLTVQELNNFETVVFLMKSGPVYNGNVYKLARTNAKMVDSLYATLPLLARQDINNRIIQQTFRQSLESSNYYLAQELQGFVSGSWSPNYLRANSSGSYYPMEYKRLTKDSLGYVNMARNYYNVNYYRVAIDSLARIDYAVERKINVSRYQWQLNRVENEAFQEWFKVSESRYKYEHAQHLSYGARQILAFSKDNMDALNDAIRWQTKAIEQSPRNGLYYHTLAMLLYKVGFSAQAEAELLRAKELYKRDKVKYQEIEALLKQMKSNKGLII